MLTNKEADLTVVNMLIDFIDQTHDSDNFGADLNDREKVKMRKSLDKYRGKLAKFRATLITHVVENSIA
jgi:hypothetical protein